jgi:hypothetical protein
MASMAGPPSVVHRTVVARTDHAARTRSRKSATGSGPSGSSFQGFHAAARALARVTAFVGRQQIGADHGLQVGMAKQRHAGGVGVHDTATAVQHQRRGDAGEKLL